MSALKQFLLTKTPFRPVHVGLWLRSLYFTHYFLRFASRRHVRSVLDAGCGRGTYATRVAQYFPHASVRGYDIDPQKEWEGPHPANLSFKKQDLRAMTESNQFDAILSIDSLEHIPGNAEVMRLFHEALRPGGMLYLAIPNGANEWHLFPRSWFDHFREWEAREHIGEQYTLPALEKQLAQAGFRILFSRYTFTLWGTLAWEIEFILHDRHWDTARILLMPVIKLLGILDIYLPLSLGRGNDLVIAEKPIVS